MSVSGNLPDNKLCRYPTWSKARIGPCRFYATRPAGRFSGSGTAPATGAVNEELGPQDRDGICIFFANGLKRIQGDRDNKEEEGPRIPIEAATPNDRALELHNM